MKTISLEENKKQIMVLLLGIMLFISFSPVIAKADVVQVPYGVSQMYKSINAQTKVIQKNGDLYEIIYGSNVAVYAPFEKIFLNGSGAGLGNIYRITSKDAHGSSWGDVITFSYKANYSVKEVIYSNTDLKYKSGGGGVFFSKATQQLLENLPTLNGLVPFVIQLIRKILVPSVAILALILGVKMIPKVLYRVF